MIGVLKSARTPQRQKRGFQREAEILSVTRRLIAELGYRRLTTLDIAKSCGITEGGIFRYFPTKQHLLTRVCSDWYADMLERGRHLAQIEDPRARLQAAIVNLLEEIRAEPELSRFVLTELRYNPDYTNSDIHRQTRAFIHQIRSALDACIAAGLLSDQMPVSLLRDMIVGTVEQATWKFLAAENRSSALFPDPENLARRILQMLWHGSTNSSTSIGAEINQLQAVARHLEELVCKASSAQALSVQRSEDG